MNKEFKYCDNPDAEVPKMFIDNEIGGKNAEGMPNIQGNDFLKELMYLSDTEGKSKIEVWINSPGGIVTDGQSIYAALLHSDASVDTICYGIAASIAGVVFQSGRKRKMYDYATLMYHPAYSDDGRVDKGLEALNNAICKMIATRTGKTEDEIWAIMNRGRADDKGTWIGAEEALANGFCDEIIRSNTKNRNSIQGETSVSIWKSANKVYNRLNEIKPKRMKTVLNKLGLIEDATETSAIAAIDALNKKAESAEEKYNKKCEEMDALNKEMNSLKNTMEEEKKAKAKAEEEMKAKADEEMKAKAEEEMKAKNKTADDTIKAAVASGKIKNDAKLIENYKTMFLSNTEATKALIESLPSSKTSPVFVPVEGTETIKDSEAEAAVRRMGLKPGSSNWYNAVKAYEIQTKSK